MNLPTVDSAWDYSDPATSETRFRELLDNARAQHADDAYIVEAQTQLARTLGLQRRFDEADALLDQVEVQLTPDMKVAAIRYELERGRVLNSSGHPEAGIPHFEHALELARGVSPYLAIDAAHMLAIASPPGQAIEWSEKAIAMAEAETDPAARHWLGPLYNNLAWTYNDLGEYEKALALFARDVAFRESIDRPFEASIALWSEAKTLRLMGRVEKALSIQRSLVDHPLRKGKPAEGYTHEEIGECLLALGKAEEAAPHFAIAFERLHEDPWLNANEADRLARIHELSKIDPGRDAIR